MRIVVWLTESTWPACVDAVADAPDAEIVLLHVVDPDTAGAADAALSGLLGRGTRASGAARTFADAQTALLAAAQERLGRPARQLALTGRAEQEVVTACADAAVLVLGRDGDHARLGPRSLGRATRFVIDHAPCRVLLVWPDEPPGIDTLPPPPPPGGPPPPPPPPHG
jgi:nucleotide-binding universal stress UspA family protein